jgi:hypothetical protein
MACVNGFGRVQTAARYGQQQTTGNRSFPVAELRIWNVLAASFRSSQLQPTFKRLPKTFSFSQYNI